MVTAVYDPAFGARPLRRFVQKQVVPIGPLCDPVTLLLYPRQSSNRITHQVRIHITLDRGHTLLVF